MRAALIAPQIALVIALAAGPALAAGASPANAAAPAPDAPPPGSGAALFDDQCGSCHTLDPASGPLAPSLRGVAGRKIASLTDFDYSAALKSKQGVWTDAALDAFLADPETFAPGNQMGASAPDPAARRAIIAYLKTTVR